GLRAGIAAAVRRRRRRRRVAHSSRHRPRPGARPGRRDSAHGRARLRRGTAQTEPGRPLPGAAGAASGGLMPLLTIARLTIWEASRRRLLLAVVALTVVIIGMSAWGFVRIWDLDNGGRPVTVTEVRLISSQLLILISFMFSFVLALSAVLLASFSLPGEVETGVVLALLARPLRRAELVLGKWLGMAVVVVGLAVVGGRLGRGVVGFGRGCGAPVG